MARKKQGNVVCKYPGCNYQIYWKSKLGRHIKSVHQNQNDFQCEVCQKSFRCNFSLNRHKGLKHKKEKGSDTKKDSVQPSQSVEKCSESAQNGSQKSKPVMIHFMRKEANAEVMCHESLVEDVENLPIQIDSEVQNSIENRSAKNQDKHLEPTAQLGKLKTPEIEIHTQKNTLQPTMTLTELKEKNSEKKNSMKKQNSVEQRKFHQKYQDISGKNEITGAEQQFVDQYNFDWWSDQKTALETKKRSPRNFDVDFTKEGIKEMLSNYKIPKYRECNIFRSHDLLAQAPSRLGCLASLPKNEKENDLFYYRTKFYE